MIELIIGAALFAAGTFCIITGVRIFIELLNGDRDDT
jgi:ascorbate-specific PTS system EIIC-type component UlaA